VSLKSLTTGVAAAAMIGAAALGVTSLAPAQEVASTPVAPMVFGIPLPMDQHDSLAAEFTGILNRLADPTVKFSNKSNLVEGGLGIIEGKTADRLLKNASQEGYLPLQFAPSAPVVTGSAATTNVVITGPRLAPTTQALTFINDGTWKLSKASATSLLQAALAAG
jgi:hypothetical protein